ncbi:unnamed protein product, partial [marine sediment metagenome]
NFSQANSGSTKYDWQVWINDGTANVSDTYHFTTKAWWATSLTLSGMSNVTNISWSGQRETEAKQLWCNGSGDVFETIQIDIVVNETHFCDNITFWFADLNLTNDSYQITGDNNHK